VIIVLLFFYLIGLGLVIGAHLNAALAIVPRLRQNDPKTSV
jgi:membrane protein